MCKNKYVSEERNLVTWDLQGKLSRGDGTYPGREGSNCHVGGIGNGQHSNEGGAGDSNKDMVKDDREKAKNMSHFSENNVCLPRMGHIMSAFTPVDQAFEFDGESHLFQFMMQKVRVVWDGGGEGLAVPR